MDSYVGKRLDGRYEIREIIGVGGMAVVYKAYDNIDDRIVAVKILKEEFLANEEFRRRFKNESKAIAVLSHPNIVKVYDVSFGDKLQYIVMEYVEGITLKEYIEQQKIINWKEALHFTTQILRALQHAHDKGIVHRDVKPQNIMLLQNGNIKVTDFGIARFSRGETRTMTESAIGSVHYISPEQARGEITDDKADIYSVGVVLYEMITGKLPFESDSAVSVAIMQLQNEAVPPRELNPEIPVGLEQITLRAMQKDPKQRYQSAAEMLLDLDELKRNPEIKFDYSYFVDKEPTKYVNTNTIMAAAAGAVSSADVNDDEEDDEETDTKNKKIPIIIGVVSAVLIVALIIILVLYFATDVFTRNKISVPNFTGMDYAEEIENNKEYTDDFKFEVKYVSSSSYEAGQVSKQDPAAGSKVKQGSTITLEVVKSGTQKEIPTVVGLEVADAQKALKSLSFSSVKTVYEYTEDYDPGIVMSVDPSEGTSVDISETVTLTVATDKDENAVEVPNLVGLSSQDLAKQYLESVGLKLGTVTEDDSDRPAGEVLSQSIDNPDTASKGEKINIVVSSGKSATKTVKLSVQLPNFDTQGTITVYVNNKYYSQDKYQCTGGTTEIDVIGTGKTDKISVTATYSSYTKTIYTCTVDFTASTPKASSIVSTYYLKVPSITSYSDADSAVSYLENFGFTNVVNSAGAVFIGSTNPTSGKVVTSDTQITVR